MPLHILLILVVGGIAGIALALHLLGLSRPLVLDDNVTRHQWLRHHPDDTFAHVDGPECLINRRADRATIRSDQGYGLVWVMGVDASARRLSDARWQETKAGLTVSFSDPGAPRIDIALDQSERHLWLNYLRKFHEL